MKFSAPQKMAFSLVEVVLSIGIVSFALLAIVGLFGNALQSKGETISRQEVLALTRSMPVALTNSAVSSGFAEVYGWVRQTNSRPEILAFPGSDGSLQIGLASDAAFLQRATSRTGRLFRIVPALSPNMPVRGANGQWIARPTPADLPANPADFTNHARLPLQIHFFEIGQPGLPIENRNPVLSYDTSLARF